MKTLAVVVNLLLGGIFLVSSLSKLHHPKSFVLTVLEYRILPPYFSKLYAIFLPPAEFFIAFFALTGLMLRLTAITMSFLLLSFIVAIGVNIKRGRQLNCNCFGVSRKRLVGKTLLIQDVVLLIAAIFISVTRTWTPIESWSIFYLIGVKNNEFGYLLAECIGTIIGGLLFFRFLSQKKIWLLIFNHSSNSLKGRR